jgi:hypothetical protein
VTSALHRQGHDLTVGEQHGIMCWTIGTERERKVAMNTMKRLGLVAAGLLLSGVCSGACDSEGVNNEGLGGSPPGDAAACASRTCAQLNANCGILPDSCGGTLDCGSNCPQGQFCGGGGPNRCGTAPCSLQTCAQVGASCGVASDRCSNVLHCGYCPTGQSCTAGNTCEIIAAGGAGGANPYDGSTETGPGTGGRAGSAGTTGTDGSGGTGSTVFQYYPSDYIWNTAVDTLPVHPMASQYIDADYKVDPDASIITGWDLSMVIAEDFPINEVDASTPRQRLTWDPPGLEGISDDILYPIPPDALVGAGSDHPMIMVDMGANMLYELYNAKQAPDLTWTAEAGVVFDLSSYALRPDGRPSTSASGLAMAPGLIRYEEVESGYISHALHVNLPTTGTAHVWPARAGGNMEDPSYPPLGQRFRLKASFDTSGFNAHQRVILAALKKYGLMLADNEGPATWFSLGAEPDTRWVDGNGYNDIGYLAFESVHFSDFEAVDVSSLMIDSNSGQAKQP